MARTIPPRTTAECTERYPELYDDSMTSASAIVGGTCKFWEVEIILPIFKTAKGIIFSSIYHPCLLIFF